MQAVPGGGNEQYVQAVLGEGIAREMGRDVGKPSLGVGDTFTLGPRQWVVVGIMKSGGKTFDSEVWAKRKVTGEMLRKDSRSTAVFRVADGLDPDASRQENDGRVQEPGDHRPDRSGLFRFAERDEQARFSYASSSWRC